MAFVRQRHGLPNGDLDRTHRQQAFIASLLYQLRTQGVLSDLTKINALLSVAKRYVITDANWNLLDLAAQMRGLTGGNLVFHTLPIKGYALIGGQDANRVDPGYIKALVHAAFYPAATRHHRHRKASSRIGDSPGPHRTAAIPSTGPQGGAVTARNGIPCVN